MAEYEKISNESIVGETDVRPVSAGNIVPAVEEDQSFSSSTIEVSSDGEELMQEKDQTPQPSQAPPSKPGEFDKMAKPMPLIDEGRIQNIKVRVQVMLGGTNVSVAELSELQEGDTIALNARIDERVKILANGHTIGTGKIVVVESNPPAFGVRLDSVVEDV